MTDCRYKGKDELLIEHSKYESTGKELNWIQQVIRDKTVAFVIIVALVGIVVFGVVAMSVMNTKLSDSPPSPIGTTAHPPPITTRAQLPAPVIREPEHASGRIDYGFDELRRMYFDFEGEYMRVFEHDNYVRVMHGHGRIEWYSGEYYVGDFFQGVIHGRGIMRGIDSAGGGFVYDGDFENNLKHGLGEIIWDDGAVYNGEWRRGKRHGEGWFIPSGNGSMIFEGIWRDDEIVSGSWSERGRR
jgi:hypothetical protein